MLDLQSCRAAHRALRRQWRRTGRKRSVLCRSPLRTCALRGGFANSGAECFIASALQVVFHAGPLCRTVAEHSCSLSTCFLCALREIEDSSRSPGSVTGLGTLRQGLAADVCPTEQQDVVSFLDFLAEHMKAEWLSQAGVTVLEFARTTPGCMCCEASACTAANTPCRL